MISFIIKYTKILILDSKSILHNKPTGLLHYAPRVVVIECFFSQSLHYALLTLMYVVKFLDRFNFAHTNYSKTNASTTTASSLLE